jgi:hypothetical protein
MGKSMKSLMEQAGERLKLVKQSCKHVALLSFKKCMHLSGVGSHALTGMYCRELICEEQYSASSVMR